MDKVALLIGNNLYPGQNQLKNAVNDAVDLGKKLESLGFLCFVHADVTKAEMDNAVIDFKPFLSKASTGLFFFAGHGVQCKNENFLTAVDSNFVGEIECKHSSISFNYIIESFEESDIYTTILILDACRNNPFGGRWRSGAISGLAPVYAPKGTIIAYATSPGQTALDGSGNNGLYTGALLQHIDDKRINIENMFKRVRHTVSALSNNEQITWEHTSLMGDFYFNAGYDSGSSLTSYSRSALADSNFIIDHKNPVHLVITKLKTLNFILKAQK